MRYLRQLSILAALVVALACAASAHAAPEGSPDAACTRSWYGPMVCTRSRIYTAYAAPVYVAPVAVAPSYYAPLEAAAYGAYAYGVAPTYASYGYWGAYCAVYPVC